MPPKPPKHTPPRQSVGTLLLGFVVFVGVPAFMTASAPVSWLSFWRNDGRVSAKIQTCVFFVFPYRTSILNDVTGVDSTFHRGDLIRRKAGEQHNHRAEDEAAIVLTEKEQTIVIPASPISVDNLKKQIQGMLSNPEQKTLSLFTVANWKVGLIFAIPMSLFTVLYVVGLGWLIGQILAKPFARRMPSKSDHESR